MRKKATKAELEEMRAHHAKALENARRLRELAEKGQAKLDAQREQR